MMKKDLINSFLTVKEFAEKLGVHPNTIRRNIKDGRIHAFRTGKGSRCPFRIPVSETQRMALFDLAKWMDEVIEKAKKERK